MKLEEVMKTMLSLICFLLLTALAISTYKQAWKEKKYTEKTVDTRTYWKEISTDHSYGGFYDLDGKETPPGWQVGWNWSGYVVVPRKVEAIYDIVDKPEGTTWLGLPKTRKKFAYAPKSNCCWCSIEKVK